MKLLKHCLDCYYLDEKVFAGLALVLLSLYSYMVFGVANDSNYEMRHEILTVALYLDQTLNTNPEIASDAQPAPLSQQLGFLG